MGTDAEPATEAVAADALPANRNADQPGADTHASTDRSPTDRPADGHAFLIVARVLRPHSTQGELACEIVTEFPERFRRTRRVFLAPPSAPGRHEVRPGAAPREYAVKLARLSNHRGHPEVILRLGGVADRNAAEALRGMLVEVPESEAWRLPLGRYYWHQIVGLRVVTTEGEEIGTVAEILETGANDVYVVKSDGRERLIPAIKQVVKRISPVRGEMVVELMPGL